MTRKRITFLFALLALLTAGVSAHDAPDLHSHRFSMRWGPGVPLNQAALLEATGMDEAALRTALMEEGSTLTQLVEANGGDVESLIASMVADASDAINENAAATINSLEETINDALQESYRSLFPWHRRHNPLPMIFRAWDLDTMLTEATGLERTALREALGAGATVAELIEANEGEVAAVASELAAKATDSINAAVAAGIERYEAGMREAFETDFSEQAKRRRGRRGPRGFYSHWTVHGGSSSAAEAEAAG